MFTLVLLTQVTQFLNAVKSKKERFGRIVQMHANKREEIKEVRAGDIAAAIGLKDVTTGDTFVMQLMPRDHSGAYGIPRASNLCCNRTKNQS